MKKFFLIQMILLLAFTASAVNINQQSEFILDGSLDCNETYVYEASLQVKLLDGFKFSPKNGNSLSVFVNRYGVFPPESGYLGGPSPSCQDGVVGALPGMLNVNDFGGAVYSIPIQLPKGLGDMTPQLSITYNNQAGNGLLGWGWDISGLSSITRVGCNEYNDGRITRVRYNSDDRFMLDGKRLLSDCSLPYGGHLTTYRTEIDDMSKIVSIASGNSTDYFIVYKADGTIWEYGNTEDSYIEPQNMYGVAMTWLVSKIYDRDGNTIVFHYTENFETGESYVNHIEYTLNTKQGVNAMYDVIFQYENREDQENLYVFRNEVKKSKLIKNIIVKDVESGKELFNYSFSYLNPGYYSVTKLGRDYFIYNRLQKIGLTADGMKLNPTVISWNKKKTHYYGQCKKYSLDKDVFNKVSFVGDFDGDGISDVLLVPYKSGNSYNDNVVAEIYINKANGTFESTPCATFVLDRHLEWVYIVDFNGDGLMDVVPYYFDYDKSKEGTFVHFFINNGDRSFSEIGCMGIGYGYRIYPGDFFGDNKTSFFVSYGEEKTNDKSWEPAIIYYQDGSCQAQNVQNASSLLRANNVMVEDMDGDGRHEIISLNDDCAIIANIDRSDGMYYSTERYTDYNLRDKDFLFPGDYNGDGNTDIVRYNRSSLWTILMSDGERFLPPVPFVISNLLSHVNLQPKDYYYHSLANLANPSIAVRTGDFDGDGKCDIGFFHDAGGNHYLELGTGFYKKASGECDFKLTDRFYVLTDYANQHINVGRFFGKENISILGTVKSTPLSYQVPRLVTLFPHNSKYSVERITDGLGNSHGFSYAYMMPRNGTYLCEHQWITDDIRTISMPLSILCTDTVYSVNGKPCCNEYKYSNAWYHTRGHGFIGYQSFVIQEYVDGKPTRRKQYTKELETMGENRMSLPSENSIFDCDGNLTMKEDVTYSKFVNNNNPMIVMPLVIKNKKVNYDYGNAKDAIKVEITESSYLPDIGAGNYANFVSLDKLNIGYTDNPSVNGVSDCEFANCASYSYSSDVDAWIINRLNTFRIEKSAKNESSVGCTEMYHYNDNANPLRLTTKKSMPNLLWDATDPQTIVTSYTYDNVGNVVEQSVSSPSTDYKRLSKVGYSANYHYLYPTTMTNEKGWKTEMSYDDYFGLSRKSVDYNGIEMDVYDDIMGVTSTSMMPDGMTKIRTKRWASGNEHAPSKAMYYYWEKSTGNAEALVFYHKSGKELRNVTFDIDSKPIYVDVTYDNFGNVSSRSLPYSQGDEVKYVYFIYDKYNRVIEEIFPNGIRHEYSYDNMTKTMTTVVPDGRTQTKKEKTNVMGWVVESTDIGGNVVSFEYFSDGKLKSSRLCNDETTKISYEYDNRRRKTRQVDPSYGETRYVYDVFGNLIETVSPKNGSVTYRYDESGALLSRIMDDGRGNVNNTQWIYDESKGRIGMLKRIVHDDSSVDYLYDDLLRLVSVVEYVNGDSYSTDYEYDAGNRECFLTYSSGVKVKKEYSNSGFLRSMLDADNGYLLWKTDATDSFGNITEYHVGNGLKTSLGYDDDFKFLNSIYTTGNNRVFQDYTYSYDGFGNLTNRSKFDGKMVSEEFEYDTFNRLTSISMNGKITGSMIYDGYGNILRKAINGTSVFFGAEYYDGPYTFRKARSYSEEELESHHISYNAFDKASNAKSNNVEMTFSYGHDLNRNMMVQTSEGKTTEKIYVNGCEYIADGNERYSFTYLEGPAGIFAVVKTDSDGGRQTFYIHKDHQNSWCVITDENCAVVQKTGYDAWGNLRDGDSWSGEYHGNLLCDRGYTGHEHVLALGLINMNGRFYDPMMSLMLSPDNYIQNPYFSQNYNRYRYCYNNPLSYQDPSGEIATWILEGIFWGCINVITNIDYIDDFGEGLLLFTAGFVSGCLTHGLSQCSWGVQVACNVGASVLKAGVNNFVKQNDGSYDWDVIDESEFKESVLFALGSSLASSTLNTYIVKPTDSEPGVCLGSLICEGYKKGHILDTTLSNFMGSLFARKTPWDEFDFSSLDIDWGNVLPNVVDALAMYFPNSKLVAILGSVDGIFGLFAGTTGGSSDNNGISGMGNRDMMSVITPNVKAIGMPNLNAPVCYSSVRSLFLNK